MPLTDDYDKARAAMDTIHRNVRVVLGALGTGALTVEQECALVFLLGGISADIPGVRELVGERVREVYGSGRCVAN